MARTFTLGVLVSRVRQRADQENGPATTEEIKGYLSTIYAELYELLVESGLRYYESVQSVSSASLTDNGDGGAYIALPTDYLGTLGVDYQLADGERRALGEMMAQERNVFSAITGASEARAYAVVGANLVLYPKPPVGQTYKHLYVPMPADLSAAADSTSVDVVVPAGEDMLIWGAARMCLAKEESDTTVAEREFSRARLRIETAALNRSLLSPRRRIVDDGTPSVVDSADWRRW